MNTNEVYTPGSSKVSTNAPGCLCDECEHCEREIRAIWLRNMNEFDKQHGHASPVTTQGYVMESPTRLRHAAEAAWVA